MSNIIPLISIFIFGSIIGSFLNVVILRLGKGSFVKGRSVCPSCGKILKWYELVPIFSFIFLRGKCSSCGSKISIQYPAVEIFTGILFLSAFIISSNFLEAIYFMVVFSFLVVIFFYDLKHKIIPDSFVYLFNLFAFFYLFIDFSKMEINIPFLENIIAGPLFFTPFFLIWFFSRGRWMGLGDAKLALGIGWFLGLSAGFSAITISIWLGAIVSLLFIFIAYIIKNTQMELKNDFLLKLKNIKMKSEIPLGPFLILGFLGVLFFNIDIITIFAKWLMPFS